MTEFFRGWRRKIGTMTLLLALVLLGGWSRNQTISDAFYFENANNDQFVILASCTDSIVVVTITDADSDGSGWQFISLLPKWETIAPAEMDFEFPDDFHWYLSWCGCRFGTNANCDTHNRMGILIVNYWSLILPLAALSVYLLLRSPPKQKVEIISSTVFGSGQ